MEEIFLKGEAGSVMYVGGHNTYLPLILFHQTCRHSGTKSEKPYACTEGKKCKVKKLNTEVDC